MRQGRPQRAVRAWTRLVTMQPMNVGRYAGCWWPRRRSVRAIARRAGDPPPILARTDADGYALRLAVLADPDGLPPR